MKKLTISLLSVIVLVAVFAASALAAPTTKDTSLYDGVFHGYLYGDKGSKAPVTLDMTQEGDTVQGTVYLGEGLYVDARTCGSTYVPAIAQYAAGNVHANNPNRATANADIDVGPLVVTIEFDGELTDGGDTLDVEAKLDLPFICGKDPQLTGTLTRDA